MEELRHRDGKMKHFRVDRMEDVELRTIKSEYPENDCPCEGKEEYDKKDMSTYTNYTISMYSRYATVDAVPIPKE